MRRRQWQADSQTDRNLSSAAWHEKSVFIYLDNTELRQFSDAVIAITLHDNIQDANILMLNNNKIQLQHSYMLKDLHNVTFRVCILITFGKHDNSI